MALACLRLVGLQYHSIIHHPHLQNYCITILLPRQERHAQEDAKRRKLREDLEGRVPVSVTGIAKSDADQRNGCQKWLSDTNDASDKGVP